VDASGLWVAFTLTASAAQTARNVMQRELTAALGALGASEVRFLFGLPFAILFFVGLRLATGFAAPTIGPAAAGFVVVGALAQIGGTALMLAAMRERSFVVVVAFTKTEAAQVALYALLFLGETPTARLVGAIALATLGVFLMAGTGGEAARAGWRPIAMGIASATFYAFAAVGFRGAVTRMDTPSTAMAATTVLVAGLAVQTAVLLVWLALFDRAGLKAILKLWRGSMVAGFMGALASQLWFVAFALTDAARVRTLALVEVLFAQAASLKLFRERPAPREWLGMVLIVVAAAMLIGG
jgi:drug/metabolite transporter (DMT)-like permease